MTPFEVVNSLRKKCSFTFVIQDRDDLNCLEVGTTLGRVCNVVFSHPLFKTLARNLLEIWAHEQKILRSD